jgi:hypothetical protein
VVIDLLPELLHPGHDFLGDLFLRHGRPL